MATILTVHEAAELVKVGEWQIRHLITKGEIRAYRFGQRGDWRFDPNELDEDVKRNPAVPAEKARPPRKILRVDRVR